MSKGENWSEYWQNEGAGGEVFVNHSGNKHEGLTQFWSSQLQSLTGKCQMIDLACGAGSVFADIGLTENVELHAADISEEALQQLNKRMPGVKTHVCSADELPFDDGSFDVVVSQFGIEYAGDGGFIEAARILRPNGKLAVLCHIEDGYIDSRNKAELEGAELISKSRYIIKAIEVVSAMFSEQAPRIQKALDDFNSVESQVSELCQRCPTGVHVHLHNGYQQLIDRRQAYDESDITNWLKAMEGEVDKAILRLGEMRKAASSEEMLNKRIVQMESDHGVVVESCKPFVLKGHSLPVAWQLLATKA